MTVPDEYPNVGSFETPGENVPLPNPKLMIDEMATT